MFYGENDQFNKFLDINYSHYVLHYITFECNEYVL